MFYLFIDCRVVRLGIGGFNEIYLEEFEEKSLEVS